MFEQIVSEHIALKNLLAEVRACRLCETELPLGPNPIVRGEASAKLLIIGQAPGTKVHATGVPWNDPSGDRLRDWLGLERDVFYDESRIAIMPMGFCYPGRGAGGDLPPRKECAQHWHQKILNHLPDVELTLLIGRYAQQHYLTGNYQSSNNKSSNYKTSNYKTLTDCVRDWQTFLPDYLPLVHPSPRNRRWLQRNPWFEEEVVPALRARVTALLAE